MLSSISSLIINVYVYKTNVNRIIFKKTCNKKREEEQREIQSHFKKAEFYNIEKNHGGFWFDL